MTPSATNEVFLTGERDATGLFRPAVRCAIGAQDLFSVETTLRLLGESLLASGKGRVRINNQRLIRAAHRRRPHHGDDPHGHEPIEFRRGRGLPGPRIRQPVRGRVVRISPPAATRTRPLTIVALLAAAGR